MNRSQKNALKQEYTFYVHSETAKLRYRFMLVFAAWSVSLIFFYCAQQLMKGAVILVVGNSISGLDGLPHIVSGLTIFTIVMTLSAIGEYYIVVKTVEGIIRGRFPPVEDKPPFSMFGIMMIFVSVLALMVYTSMLIHFMWFNWSWNGFTLPSLIIAIGAILLGCSAGITAYKLLRRYERATT